MQWKVSEGEVFIIVEIGFYSLCNGGSERSLQFGRVSEGGGVFHCVRVV